MATPYKPFEQRKGSVGHAGAHKFREGAIDNRMVKDDHKEGIRRVIQRDHTCQPGHFGKMGVSKHSEKSYARHDASTIAPVKG